MISIDQVYVSGFDTAIRGMRNPLNSWEKSDTNDFGLGENDLVLMKKLIKAGTDHSKFRRFITVTCDITAPLYWWKEFDTYKVGTVANSCSTMHTITKTMLNDTDFSGERLDIDGVAVLKDIIDFINFNITNYNSSQNEDSRLRYWNNIIQLLPTSYNQKRTVLLNYEVLANMYHSRNNHKLQEWRCFCEWIGYLPYSDLITE